MNISRYIKLFDTFGWIAIASLIICGLTGVFLVIPYNPLDAYLSVTSFITLNAAASFTRNLHYWSAQLFLIFTILHFVEHYLVAGNAKRIKPKLWLILVLSLAVVFYVMLSGFILKDDADSRQAHLILTSLISSIPFIGKTLSLAIAGNDKHLMILYLHHAATGTIIIFMVIYEHVRSIKVKWKTFLIVFFFLVVISYLFRAPLGRLEEIAMKGPWYFIGIQELLHLLTYPLLVILFVAIFLGLIYFTPFLKGNIRKHLKITVLVLAVIYTVLSFTGYFFRGAMYNLQFPWQKEYLLPAMLDFNVLPTGADTLGSIVNIDGGAEGCMTCHGQMEGFSKSHDPKVMGCFSCHGGDPFTLDKDAAHKGMYTVPGNLSNSVASCGSSNCHADIVERVPNSMMASLSGMIAVDKWVFGENKTPDGHFHVSNLKDSPSDVHLKNLCTGCHLGMEKTVHGNDEWTNRGGGCLACHLTYSGKALSTLDEIKRGKHDPHASPGFHPAIDINITNDKCRSCHSRSGRISMSYEGWNESILDKIPEGENSSKYNKLPDGRIFTAMPADVHHESGMACVDCHGSYELMGDGNHYQHKEEAVKIKCEDCHVNDKPSSVKLSSTDRETQLIAWIRDWSEGDPRIIVTANSKHPLVNTRVSGNSSTMLVKSTGKELPMKPTSPACTKHKVHDRLTCEACHTKWVPQCIGCHNTYEKSTAGFDLTKRTKVKGTWIEFSGEINADYPVLGMKEVNKPPQHQKVSTFTPGMVMDINIGSFTGDNKTIFHRLFAPVSGHTTSRQPRDCKSCHNNPSALGYGSGTLTLLKDGTWSFAPIYQDNPNDNLPEDAWTGFLKERKDASATRSNMRPFNVVEQRAILGVGACLTCHEEGSRVINACLVDFEAAKRRKTPRCIEMK